MPSRYRLVPEKANWMAIENRNRESCNTPHHNDDANDSPDGRKPMRPKNTMI